MMGSRKEGPRHFPFSGAKTKLQGSNKLLNGGHFIILERSRRSARNVFLDDWTGRTCAGDDSLTLHYTCTLNLVYIFKPLTSDEFPLKNIMK